MQNINILVINGSPKGRNSDTMCITDAFLEGVGIKAEYIEAIKKDVKPCLGCFGCWWGKTPGKCVQQDDMEEILDKIKDADLIIWSMPLYCYGMPSHVKAIVDRMLVLSSPEQVEDGDGGTYHPVREKRDTKMMLISGCGFANTENNFEGLEFQMEHMFGEYESILVSESPLFHIKEAEPLTIPFLALVKKAGEEYKELGHISAETKEKLSIPMIPPEEYRQQVNEK